MIHVHVAYLTKHNIFSNNRGETEGNIATLQKVTVGQRTYTTHSGETIKFALRVNMILLYPDAKFNRTWDESGDNAFHKWEDPSHNPKTYFDDDLLGYMATKPKQGKSKKDSGEEVAAVNGSSRSRRSRWEFSRAISLDPYKGDISFNTRSRAAATEHPTPYQAEFHATRYQFGCTLTPNALAVPARAHKAILALASLSKVGGNQAGWMNDYSPESIIIRVTHDIPHGMLEAFEAPDQIPSLLRSFEVGDIDPKETIIGGHIAETDHGKAAKKLGANTILGIKKTVQAASELLAAKGIKP